MVRTHRCQVKFRYRRKKIAGLDQPRPPCCKKRRLPRRGGPPPVELLRRRVVIPPFPCGVGEAFSTRIRMRRRETARIQTKGTEAEFRMRVAHPTPCNCATERAAECRLAKALPGRREKAAAGRLPEKGGAGRSRTEPGSCSGGKPSLCKPRARDKYRIGLSLSLERGFAPSFLPPRRADTGRAFFCQLVARSAASLRGNYGVSAAAPPESAEREQATLDEDWRERSELSRVGFNLERGRISLPITTHKNSPQC